MNILMPHQHHCLALQSAMGGCKMPPLMLNTEDVISAWELIGGDIYSDPQHACGPSPSGPSSPGSSEDASAMTATLPPFISALPSFLAPAQPMDPFHWAGCSSKFPLHAPFILPMASSQPPGQLQDYQFHPKDHHDSGALDCKPACSGSSLSSGSDVALVPDATSPASTGGLPSSPGGMMSQAVKLLPVMAQSIAAGIKGTGEVETRSRKECLERYKEKKARRLYTKKIRYQLRKINADRRPRIKGRFVKKEELEEYLSKQQCGEGVGPQVSDLLLDESEYEEEEEEEEAAI